MFRFTIRDVLWLMEVVAVVCVWRIDHQSEAARNYDTEMLDS